MTLLRLKSCHHAYADAFIRQRRFRRHADAFAAAIADFARRCSAASPAFRCRLRQIDTPPMRHYCRLRRHLTPPLPDADISSFQMIYQQVRHRYAL